MIRYFWIVSLQLARPQSLITASQIFTREPLAKSFLLCYNGCRKKSTSAGACGSREVEENMEFGFRPQSWPYTVPDYVETVLERAHESSDFRLKSIKNHSKTLILQGVLRLGRRCRRFEPCHSDQIWLWEAIPKAFFFVFCDSNFEGWRFVFRQPSLLSSRQIGICLSKSL